jgi:hypothetical protein
MTGTRDIGLDSGSPNRAACFRSAPSLCQRIPISTEIFSAAGCWGKWILRAASLQQILRNLEQLRSAVNAMTFRKPVYVGDVMCIYTDLIQVGTTSIRIHIEAWVIRRNQTSRFLVTEGNFTYVALDDERRPRHVQR